MDKNLSRAKSRGLVASTFSLYRYSSGPGQVGLPSSGSSVPRPQQGLLKSWPKADSAFSPRGLSRSPSAHPRGSVCRSWWRACRPRHPMPLPGQLFSQGGRKGFPRARGCGEASREELWEKTSALPPHHAGPKPSPLPPGVLFQQGATRPGHRAAGDRCLMHARGQRVRNSQFAGHLAEKGVQSEELGWGEGRFIFCLSSAPWRKPSFSLSPHLCPPSPGCDWALWSTNEGVCTRS